jgi:RNA polymerase sigma-70 factor (ECF subfamily)
MDPRRRAREERFERLFAACRDPLARYLARRAEPDSVEDLFAEVMTVAWRRLDEVPVDAELPWLYGVGRRVLANHRRAGSRFGRLMERITFAERREEAVRLGPVRDAALEEAIARLPAGDREVLRLWAWEDLSPAEIAAVLGISANAASIRLHRAKRRLADTLETDPRKVAALPGHPPGVEQEAR